MFSSKLFMIKYASAQIYHLKEKKISFKNARQGYFDDTGVTQTGLL